ncbi:MAG: hypothetical protein RLZ33_1012 [Bacteroidota bacterium]|jgi:ABC-type bacteriocin/lantibiotic exporter with double-glycine peptidase domain
MVNQTTSVFSRFIGLLKPDYREIKNIYIFAVFSGILSLGLPLGIQMIINFIQVGQVSTSWIILVLLVVGAIGFSGLLNIYQMKITENLQQRVFTRAAFEFSGRIPQMKLLEMLKLNANELTNRFFDTLTIQKGISKLLIDFTAATLQVLFGLILLSFYHSFFIFIGLFLVVLLYVIVRLTAKKGFQSSLKESSYKYKIANWLHDVSRARLSFKMASKERLHMDTTNKHLHDYLGARDTHFTVLMQQYSFLIAFKILIALTLLIVGGFLVINQQMNIGQFVASEIIILLVLSSVEKLILSLDVIYDVFTAIEKIGQVTDLPLEVHEGEILENQTETGMCISIRDLSFKSHYSPKKLLDHLTVDIQANQTVCLVSDSSSSNAALFYLLTGICDNAKGSISFDKVPQANLNSFELREQIGTVFEHDYLINATIFENIQFGRKDVSLKQVVAFAEEIGLSEFVNSLPEKYSTPIDSEGHFIPRDVVVKILLLRSIVKQPRLLLLDEPTAGLNSVQTQQILEKLNSLKGVTRIFASNDPEIHKISDSLIYIENGKPRIEGTNQQTLN